MSGSNKLRQSCAYSFLSADFILNKSVFISALMLSLCAGINLSMAGRLDGAEPAKVISRPIKQPVTAINSEFDTSNSGAINSSAESNISLNSFPEKPIDPPRGDMPAVNSAKPAGKRTVPYDTDAANKAAVNYAEVDNSLQVLPDTLQPTPQEKKSEVVSLAEISNPKSSFYRSRGMFLDDGSIRSSVVSDAARGVGVRAGFSYEAARINSLLKSRYQNTLNTRFPFFHLMLGSGRVVPPVIGEANNIQERGGNNFLYLSIGSYEIVKPATLAIREPSWMDYLLLPVSDPRPPEGIRAEGSKELDQWKKSVEAGWNVGKLEARRTFIANLNRLIRDYKGMQLYHSLAAKGAITIPRVQSIKRNRRVDGDRLFVGEERMEIKVSAKFKR